MVLDALAETLYSVAIAYDASNNPEYVGEAILGSSKADAVWRIKRITYDASNNPTFVAWASGTSDFDKIWNDHTGYTYS